MKKVVKPDVIELISKLQEQINIIDRKIDTLISKSGQRPPEATSFQKPFHPQQSPRPQGNVAPVQGNGYRERVLHKAICADCKKPCEVPFKPSGERPVYCKDCFSKRKAGGPPKARPDNRPRVSAPIHPPHVHVTEIIEKKKPSVKKKPVSKKKKK